MTQQISLRGSKESIPQTLKLPQHIENTRDSQPCFDSDKEGSMMVVTDEMKQFMVVYDPLAESVRVSKDGSTENLYEVMDYMQDFENQIPK